MSNIKFIYPGQEIPRYSDDVVAKIRFLSHPYQYLTHYLSFDGKIKQTPCMMPNSSACTLCSSDHYKPRWLAGVIVRGNNVTADQYRIMEFGIQLYNHVKQMVQSNAGDPRTYDISLIDKDGNYNSSYVTHQSNLSNEDLNLKQLMSLDLLSNLSTNGFSLELEKNNHFNFLDITQTVSSVINDHVCPTCKNDKCSRTEKTCWKCGGQLH